MISSFTLLPPRIKTSEEIRAEQRAALAMEELEKSLHNAFVENLDKHFQRRARYKKSGSVPQLFLAGKIIYRHPKQKHFYDFTNEEMRLKIISTLMLQESKSMRSKELALAIGSTKGAVQGAVGVINENLKRELKISERLICGSRLGYSINPKFRLAGPLT